MVNRTGLLILSPFGLRGFESHHLRKKIRLGGLAERSIALVLKTRGATLHRFESCTHRMIPHLFKKEHIPKITNPALKKAISRVKRASDLEDAMKTAAYEINKITEPSGGARFQTLPKIKRAFEKDPNILWSRKGYMHCTHQNYLVRILLVKSGWLKDKQITLGYSLIWYISPHQYLKIKLDKHKTIAIDPWNMNRGAKLGEYATVFGYKKLG